ncbi:MAG: alpha/beta hydrolase fold protein [Mucilaginibacter sp.]|jgi:pimeloyl-ACP methyl ester carboxylesterase|nr:alpha/beta hydrolase fold protein [Mucilaginibacter sp.]
MTKNKTMENLPPTCENAKTAFVKVNDVQIAYRTIGSPSAIPLLCLQHFTGNMNDWDPSVINGLSKDRQVIIFDNTGVGESGGKTPDNVPAMAVDTLAFLKAIKLEKVDLLGFSLGGFISQLMMSEKPELVRKAILAGTCQQGGEGIENFRNFVNGAEYVDGAERYLYYFFENSERSRSLGYAVLKRFLERDPKWAPEYTEQTILAQTEAIVGWGNVPDSKTPLLTKIKHPVLIINGSNDHMFATVNSYIMFQQLSNAILSLYPDSAHGSLFQYPKLFNNEANYFLDNEI